MKELEEIKQRQYDIMKTYVGVVFTQEFLDKVFGEME
jgi:hypothetical protein